MQKRPANSPTSVDETLVDAESADSESDRASAAPDPLIGATLLDTYKIERVMGEGGMGRIYEARHLRLGDKRFAIKVLRPELVASAQIRGRFEREVEAVARVTHQGVVAISDVGTTPQGLPFMVCEHLSGLDLLAYTRRFGALPDARVVHMGCRIAEALEAAHAQGVIHRDIKPSNVFLLGAFAPLGPEWDRVKVIDFGLSRLVGRDDLLTETGVVLGTPAYMSPEQARGLRTDHRTDVYGVGAVMYAAATGVPPFREKTPQQTLIAVMSHEPARPRDLNPAISEELELVIQRALSKQPHERHPSMSALRLALSNLEQHGPEAAKSTAVRRRASGLRGVRVRYAALAACAAVLFVAALVSTIAGLIPLAGSEFELTAAEQLALAGLAATGVILFVRWLKRFEREVWRNTAKLSDGLPRLRAPVFWAIVAYALASFAIRFGDDVLPHFAPGVALARPPEVWSGWGAVLSLAALLTALVVALHQSWWQPMRPGRRWIWGPLLAAGMALASLAVGRWALLESSARDLARAARDLAIRGGDASGLTLPAPTEPQPPAHDATPIATAPPLPHHDAGARRTDASPGNDAGAAGHTEPSDAPQLATLPEASPPEARSSEARSPESLPEPQPFTIVPAPLPPIVSAATLPPAPSSETTNAHGSEAPAPSASPAPPATQAPSSPRGATPGTSTPPSAPTPAPSPTTGLTVSVARDAEPPRSTSGAPSSGVSSSGVSSGDREALRVEILLHARRVTGLGDAVLAIERLLAVAPDMSRDPELRRILVRAATMGGDTQRAAFRVMTTSMGSEGPDLLYQIMTERPSLADEAKFLLSRTRVRKLFSPELAIAYDLRFSTSCSSRRGLLKRATEIGDQRTINTLSALLENPPHCGEPGRFPCLDLCRSEELYFTKAIDAIVRRVRGNERAASMN
ncbi:MAG TPA: protein kinase [Polyangiaceae bacterium]|nr:protein kinase [Polyangiaceae bacterium]